MKKNMKRMALLCAGLLLVAMAVSGCSEKPAPFPKPSSVVIDTAEPENTEEPAQTKPGKEQAPKPAGNKTEGGQKGEKDDGPGGMQPAVEETPVPSEEPAATPAPCTHKWKVTDTKKPTCEKEGYETSTCELCGKDKKKTLEKTGEHEEYVSVDRKGTCQQPAQRQYACRVCGTITRTETGSYGDHDWWVESDPPTCVYDGGTISICRICDEEKLYLIPATGHDFVDGVCNNCGEVAKG